jgi:hypothetical protein
MYQTDHFVRFVNSAEQAERDLEIGHSWYPGEDDAELDGLSGFGPFETVEEAREVARKGFLIYPFVAIFTGRYVAADPDEGDLFRPLSIIEVEEVR